MRLPGHGTAPSPLAKMTWQDMAAAVRLAMTHLATNVDPGSSHVIGDSNGAALAVDDALEARVVDRVEP